MPINYSHYPADWFTRIRPAILERAGNCCEECGAPDRALILRSTVDPAVYVVFDPAVAGYRYKGELIRLSEMPSAFDDAKEVKVILTIHHKGVDKPDGTPGDRHDKMDCRPENLAALCQRCHFLADLDIHIEKAQKTRAAKKRAKIVALGQTEFLP